MGNNKTKEADKMRLPRSVWLQHRERFIDQCREDHKLTMTMYARKNGLKTNTFRTYVNMKEVNQILAEERGKGVLEITEPTPVKSIEPTPIKSIQKIEQVKTEVSINYSQHLRRLENTYCDILDLLEGQLRKYLESPSRVKLMPLPMIVSTLEKLEKLKLSQEKYINPEGSLKVSEEKEIVNIGGQIIEF